MFADKQKGNQLPQTGMKQDWSWTHSAREYVSVYERSIEKRLPRLSEVGDTK